MKRAFLLSVIGIFAFFGFSTPIYSAELPSELANEIQSLNSELQTVQASEKALLAEQASLESEKNRLISTKELLDNSANNFKSEVSAFKNELQAHNAEATRQRDETASIDAEITAHNSQCQGSSSDQSFVNACNSRASQLNARGEQLAAWGRQITARAQQINDRRDTLLLKEKSLKDRYADLQRGVLDWTKRQKEHNWKLNELQRRKQVLSTRLQAAFNDLTQRNVLSQECKAIAEKITPGDATNPSLSTPLEQAHRCLQRVWDGAK